ncbi:hypothetical protein ES703_93165 [subsurface metagenome]
MSTYSFNIAGVFRFAPCPAPLKISSKFKIVAAFNEILDIVRESYGALGPFSVVPGYPLVIVEPYVLFKIPYCGSCALG